MHSGLQMSKLAKIPLPRAPMPMARRFMQITSAIWAEACAGDSMSNLEFGTVGALQREPHLDQISLAARIGVDRTNIGLIIDGLEKRGFVERSVNPNDRRARLIRVTPEGVAAHARQAPRTALVREKVFAPLTAAEREVFYDLLERIIAANEQYSIPGAGRRKRDR
ncbi:MAG: MarR family transcriptional regulator [Hyphomicrobiaceae bacterium]|nr:MarR family transcriptional regulator [Hyphomicrobiaceae bacterium]